MIPGLESRIGKILASLTHQCGVPDVNLSRQSEVINMFPCFFSVPFPNVSVVL
jgi:hypothetical protein